MDVAFLFDFGGTLDADGIPWSDRFFAASEAGSHGVDAGAFAAAFRESDRRLEAQEGIGSLGFRATLDAQARLLGPLLGDPAWYDAALVAARVHEDAVRTAERNRPLLAELALLGPLAVVSNFTGNVAPCLEELGLRACFTAVLDSAREGVRKPEPEIFRRALARVGGPARAWMVGDNFGADIRPAAALGLATCWLAPAERAEPEPGIASTRIASLTEFPGVVACTA